MCLWCTLAFTHCQSSCHIVAHAHKHSISGSVRSYRTATVLNIRNTTIFSPNAFEIISVTLLLDYICRSKRMICQQIFSLLSVEGVVPTAWQRFFFTFSSSPICCASVSFQCQLICWINIIVNVFFALCAKDALHAVENSQRDTFISVTMPVSWPPIALRWEVEGFSIFFFLFSRPLS